MGLISKRERFKVAGRRVVVRPISQNLGFWNRDGCVVILRARRRRRRGMEVRIKNVYFAEVDVGSSSGSGFDAVWSHEKHTNGNRRTPLSEYKLWLGVKVADGTTKPDPKGIKDFVKIKGVFSFIKVSKGDKEKHLTVKAGKIAPDLARITTDHRPSWYRE